MFTSAIGPRRSTTRMASRFPQERAAPALLPGTVDTAGKPDGDCATGMAGCPDSRQVGRTSSLNYAPERGLRHCVQIPDGGLMVVWAAMGVANLDDLVWLLVYRHVPGTHPMLTRVGALAGPFKADGEVRPA